MGAKCSVRRGFEAASLVHLVLVVEGLVASSFRRPHTVQDKEASQRQSPTSTPAQGPTSNSYCTGMGLVSMPPILMPAYKQAWQ